MSSARRLYPIRLMWLASGLLLAMESSFTSASDGSLSLVIYMLFLFLSHTLTLSLSLFQSLRRLPPSSPLDSILRVVWMMALLSAFTP